MTTETNPEPARDGGGAVGRMRDVHAALHAMVEKAWQRTEYADEYDRVLAAVMALEVATEDRATPPAASSEAWPPVACPDCLVSPATWNPYQGLYTGWTCAACGAGVEQLTATPPGGDSQRTINSTQTDSSPGGDVAAAVGESEVSGALAAYREAVLLNYEKRTGANHIAENHARHMVTRALAARQSVDGVLRDRLEAAEDELRGMRDDMQATRKVLGAFPYQLTGEAAAKVMAALATERARAEALGADAERWRWLRATLEGAVGGGVEVNDARLVYEQPTQGEAVRVYWYPNTPVGFIDAHGDTLDEAVDRARAAESEVGHA